MTVGTISRIKKYLQENELEVFELLKQLIRIESPTDDIDAQHSIFFKLREELRQVNFVVKVYPGKASGGVLLAYPKERIKRRPIQLIVGHCDTVWPLNTLDSMPLRSENNMITGPGAFDMKAGLTQIVFALKAIATLQLNTSVTPVVLFNSDEEKGSRESGRNIARLAKIAKRAYILEPPLGLEGKLKTARKGIGKFELTIHGIPSHAGLDPSKGVSAILELSYQIQKLFELNDREKGITVNVGMIEGGMKPNVVAPTSKAIIDVRVLTAKDGEQITKMIHGLKPIHPQSRLEISGSIGRPPMEKTERNRRLWLKAKNLSHQLGIDLDEGVAGGGSDGNTTSLYTATLDGLGTPGDGAHARHEFIFNEKLIERTVLLTHLLLMN